MSGRKSIRFELLGLFSCGKGEDDKWRQNTAGRKELSLLQYLIVNHARSVSSEELIDRFWAQSNDPINALRGMIYKIRKYLREMFPEEENMIVTRHGNYGWNPALQIELDSEVFEQACKEARRRPQEAAEILSQALPLYKGDFLAGNDSDWVIPMRRYYQTLYLDACREVLPLLQNQERWMEIITVCEQAQNVDFAAEDFVNFQMQALISLGQSARAMEQYRQFRERLWKEFQIAPSEEMEQTYALASGMCRGIQGKDDILKMVTEEENDGRAFFCTFRTFQKIVSLERRHLARTRGTSTLMIVGLENQVIPGTDAKRLERVLLNSLRSGDPVAKLDAVSYVVMLTGTSFADAQNVAMRIDRTFRRMYSHSRACLSFRTALLEENQELPVENLPQAVES
ncbi:MAG TPA: hypothetical protein DCZ91_20785 [Lachnospiraceae bacterium]|nr:hypothetical protein [Lachnospiraceae bacterium]